MSATYHTLSIVVCIKGLTDEQDIYMELRKMVPFVPQEGMVLELWRDDTEEGNDTYQLELGRVYYSFRESMFIEEHDDTDLMESARAGEVIYSDREAFVEWYRTFGFKRLNYPTAQVVRHD